MNLRPDMVANRDPAPKWVVANTEASKYSKCQEKALVCAQLQMVYIYQLSPLPTSGNIGRGGVKNRNWRIRRDNVKYVPWA